MEQGFQVFQRSSEFSDAVENVDFQELKSVNFGDGASFQNIEYSSISSAQPAIFESRDDKA